MPEPPIPARYAILLELLRAGPLRTSDLVEPTGLTLQGVAYHLKQLEAEGLVSMEGEERRGARLTQVGVESLHDHFLGLKAFVDVALAEMLPVEECVAVAAEDVDAGDNVGLFMEAGRLVARRRPSPSEGRARASARAGEPVVVTGLTGVVDLDPGDVHLVRLPPPTRLPAPDALARFVEDKVPAWDALVVAGIEAEILVERAELDGAARATRFAPGPAARHAAQLGLDVLLVASWDTAGAVLDAVQEAAGPTARRATVHVHDLPPRS